MMAFNTYLVYLYARRGEYAHSTIRDRRDSCKGDEVDDGKTKQKKIQKVSPIISIYRRILVPYLISDF